MYSSHPVSHFSTPVACMSDNNLCGQVVASIPIAFEYESIQNLSLSEISEMNSHTQENEGETQEIKLLVLAHPLPLLLNKLL